MESHNQNIFDKIDINRSARMVTLPMSTYERIERFSRAQQKALERVMAECKVSTDNAFYNHLKLKVEKILGYIDCEDEND